MAGLASVALREILQVNLVPPILFVWKIFRQKLPFALIDYLVRNLKHCCQDSEKKNRQQNCQIKIQRAL